MSKIKRHLFGSSVDLGLFVLRFGIGFQMALHGWPKIIDPSMWDKIGSNMPLMNGGSLNVFWGFMAAFAEFGGGILLLLGWFTRPAAFLSAFTMLVASIYHWSEPDATWMSASHSFELFFVFVALYVTGPGKISLDAKFHHPKV